jgi:hypothetical protein
MIGENRDVWEKMDKKVKYFAPLFILLLIVYLYDSLISSVMSSQVKSLLEIVIISYFAFELIIKYVLSDNFKSFIKNYWIDIILLIPFFKSLKMVTKIGKSLKLLKFLPYAQKFTKVPKMLLKYLPNNEKNEKD